MQKLSAAELGHVIGHVKSIDDVRSLRVAFRAAALDKGAKIRLRKAQYDVVKSVVAPRLARTPSNFCDTAQLFDMTLAECELGEKFHDTLYKTPSNREAARRVQTTTLVGSVLTRSIMYPSLPDVRDPFGKAGELKPTRVTEAVIRKFHSHMQAQLPSAVKSVMEAEPLGWVKDMDGDLHDPERLSKLVAKKMGLPAGAFKSLSMRNHITELAAPILDAQWKDFGVHVRAVVEMLGETKFRWNHVQWSLERRLKLRDGALKNAKETAIALAA